MNIPTPFRLVADLRDAPKSEANVFHLIVGAPLSLGDAKSPNSKAPIGEYRIALGLGNRRDLRVAGLAAAIYYREPPAFQNIVALEFDRGTLSVWCRDDAWSMSPGEVAQKVRDTARGVIINDTWTVQPRALRSLDPEIAEHQEGDEIVNVVRPDSSPDGERAALLEALSTVFGLGAKPGDVHRWPLDAWHLPERLP